MQLMPGTKTWRWWRVVAWAATGIVCAVGIELLGRTLRGKFIWPREEPSVIFTAAAFGLAFLFGAASLRYWPRARVYLVAVIVILTLAGLFTHLYYWHRWTLFVVEPGRPRDTGVRTVVGRYRDDIQDELTRLRREGRPVPNDDELLEEY